MQTEKSRKIEMKGTGSTEIQPDAVEVRVQISDRRKTYDAVVKKGTEIAEAVLKVCEECDISREDIKTISYRIREINEYSKDRRGNTITDSKYEIRHNLGIKCGLDYKKIEFLTHKIGAIETHPIYTLVYKVENSEQYREELLHKTIMDCKRKAEIIANAGGARLGELKFVEYSWKQKDIIVETKGIDMGSTGPEPMRPPIPPSLMGGAETVILGGTPDKDVTPDIESKNITLTEEVYIEWGIE